ncbi:MAG TPA: hypothetical protein VFU71_10130, partial [Burkholderiaceae bacterium]|nr:hypothetical protein [Burkholderiaceae bacterium]
VVERVVVERFGGPGCPAVEIVPDNTPMGSAFSFGARVLGSRGDAVRVQGVRVMGAANTLNISSCEISGSAGDGLVWTDDSQQQLSVSSCNLTGNAGVGIRNQTISGQLMARDNWWGDAAGPGGLNGDGVAGNVAAAAPLAAPVSLGY